MSIYYNRRPTISDTNNVPVTNHDVHTSLFYTSALQANKAHIYTNRTDNVILWSVTVNMDII